WRPPGAGRWRHIKAARSPSMRGAFSRYVAASDLQPASALLLAYRLPAARHGIYLVRLPTADLLLRAVRFFLRVPRWAFFREPVRPRSLSPRLLRPRVLATGPRTSEKISQPTPAAISMDATGLLRACLARIGRTSSPQARGLTPPSRSLTTVDGETW